jgi:hypothetical protein
VIGEPLEVLGGGRDEELVSLAPVGPLSLSLTIERICSNDIAFGAPQRWGLCLGQPLTSCGARTAGQGMIGILSLVVFRSGSHVCQETIATGAVLGGGTAGI